MKTMRSMIVITTALLGTAAHAQYANGTVKIGVLTDMSSLYSDIGGPGSVTAAKLAVQDPAFFNEITWLSGRATWFRLGYRTFWLIMRLRASQDSSECNGLNTGEIS